MCQDFCIGKACMFCYFSESQGHRVKYLLSVESSCDETAAAVITEDMQVLSSIIASQEKLHEVYGGVVPEIASRAHLEQIIPVIDQALQRADLTLQDLTAIAVATEPGLVGSLLVGVTAAKTLAWSLGIPLIAINHVQAHLYACQMTTTENLFPAIGMVVSGGHTNIYNCQTPLDFTLIGSTIDDAAGEAFDKVSQILNLGFPGGPAIQKQAEQGNPHAFQFPQAFKHEDRLDFSFSGIKTSVLYEAHGQPGKKAPHPELTPKRVSDIAASFQLAVVEILVLKAILALEQTGHKTLLIGGGVAANRIFREKLTAACDKKKIRLVIAPMDFCTDNAAMGALGWELYHAGKFAPLEIDVTPGLVRIER